MDRSPSWQRMAIVLASIGALAILGFAVAAVPETAPAVDPALAGAGPTAGTEIAAPTPGETIEIDTVYVEPAATPGIIRKVRRATAAPAAAGEPTTATLVDGSADDDTHEDVDDDHEDADGDHHDGNRERGDDDDHDAHEDGGDDD